MTTKEAMLVGLARKLAEDGTARRLRMEARLTQTEVGEVVGRSAQAVTRWENGSRRPTGIAALKYGRLLQALESAQDREPAA